MKERSQSDQELVERLRSLEESLLKPAVRRDPVRVRALPTDDFVEFGASGRVWNRDQVLELLATENYSEPTVVDFQCALLAENVALLTYRAVRMDTQKEVETASLRSSLWVQKAGAWRMRFHQGTREP